MTADRALAHDVLVRDVGDRTILLNLATGTYLLLNPTARELWRLYAAHGVDGAVDAAAGHFGVAPERIVGDLTALLDQVASLRAGRSAGPRRPSRLPWQALLRLAPRDLARVAGAAACAAAVEVALRTLPLPRIVGLLGIRLGDGAPEAPEGRHPLTPAERARLRAADRVFGHWPFEASCLRRALVAGALLRPRDVTLHLGVAAGDIVEHGRRLDEGAFVAHAWLETGGPRLLALPGYVPLATGAPA